MPYTIHSIHLYILSLFIHFITIFIIIIINCIIIVIKINIIDIRIQLHSQVKAGDTLFQIDPESYEIAVLKAEANFDNTTQSVAASTSSVKSAAGRLGVAKAQLDRAQRNWNRVERVMKENAGALSENDIPFSSSLACIFFFPGN